MSNSNVVHQEDFKSCNNLCVPVNNVALESSQEQEPRIQPAHSIKHKMYIFFREICLLLLLVFTYATFQNTIPKSSKSPNAYPFFPVGSIVKDWYHGQLSDAIELASESDLAFIMYYAPWDAESQTVRREFAVAAQHMHTEVHFAAINCWQPNSECRQQYSKVYSWPVLMAYPAHGRGIQYRGPRKAEHMLRFLQIVANPFIRIYSAEDVAKYNAISDAVVVSEINARLGENDYGIIYYTALQFLERDPFRDVVFLVHTHAHATSRLTLHLWNSTLTYGQDWHPDKILNWLSDNLHQVSTWVSPTGGKSESLSSYLQPGPALILFTPKNPLHVTVDYYSVLHDVALNYYNCNNKLQKKRAINLSLRKEHNEAYKALKAKCARLINSHKSDTEFGKWTNSSLSCARMPNEISSCAANRNQHEHIKTCKFHRIAEQLQPAIFAPFDDFDPPSSDNLTGLACKTNSSLSFLALDSLQYHYFAEGLGIDLLNVRDKSAVVILNPMFETHHVMKQTFNTANLQKFIWNFSKGYLKRSLSSSVATRQFTHHYVKPNSTEFAVRELNTNNFLPTVLDNQFAIVVMYYSRKCAFCGGVSHSFLTVANILEALASNLRFARIDGDNEALPWEYTMHHYPNILYFPSRRKSESRVFPQNVPISVKNLLSFILANVEFHVRINVMWAVCNQTMFEDDLNTCIRNIKSECVTQIGQLLKVYRLSYNRQQRRELLKHLQHLRTLHFLLEEPMRRQLIDRHVKLLQFIENYQVPMKFRI